MSSLSRFLQSFLAFFLFVLFLLDISCPFSYLRPYVNHPIYSNYLNGLINHEGGMNMAEVRRFYHKKLESIPPAKKLVMREDVVDDDGVESGVDMDDGDGVKISAEKLEQVTILEGGVATREVASGVREFFDDDICELAEKAVGIRKSAR